MKWGKKYEKKWNGEKNERKGKEKEEGEKREMNEKMGKINDWKIHFKKAGSS